MPRAVAMNPRKSASQERSRATVEALLDATARILVREGYERASTNRIAAVAGVSVGSLYQYFPNKESIVAALLARHNREILDLLRESMAAVAGLDLETALRKLIGAMIDAHHVDPDLHRIFDEQIPRMGKLAEIRAIDREILVMVRAYLAGRQDEIAVTDLDVAAFICVTTVETLTHEAVIHEPGAIDPAILVDEVTRLLVGYLRPTRPALAASGP